MVSPPHPSRRSVVLGGLSAAVLAACGGSSDPAASTPTPTAPSQTVTGLLTPGFPDGLRTPAMLVAGTPQLVPVFLAADTGRPLQADEAPAQLAVQIVDEDGTVIDEQVLAARGDGIPSPHYSVIVDVAEPGIYAIAAEIGGAPQTAPFMVVTASEAGLVQIGDPLRPLDTPTTANARGVDPICTLQPEPCPFHEATLTEAIAGSTPVVLLISTPAFCQTAICGPVLGLMIEAAADRSDLTVVHAEVWRNADAVFTADGSTEVIGTYALGYEPSLFVADASGIVTARLDLSWDRTELAEAIATLA